MIDFAPDDDVAEVRDRVAEFVRTTVIPAEARDVRHGLDDSLRGELQAQARSAGLFAPHVSLAYGGLGLDHRGQAVVFEEAGYSLLGPQALILRRPRRGQHAPALAAWRAPQQQ